jgi:hypothetical protein
MRCCAVPHVGLAALLLVSLSIGCAAVATVEEPPYVVERSADAVEVRAYSPRVIAETVVSGDREQASSAGFQRLAGYIFGGNTTTTKIAMTAPVGQLDNGRKLAMTAPVGQVAAGEGSWTVSFTMPRDETLATLPQPNDQRVTLRELPPTRVAVIRFSGRWTEESFTRHALALRSWLSAQGLSTVGEIEVNRYDAPWTPWFMRRNELWLTLAEATPTSSSQ